MAVLINFWRPTVDTDAVGESLLIENEQERVEATLSLIKFDGLVSLFKSRTCEWIVIRTNSDGRVVRLYVGNSLIKVVVDDIEATAYTDVHPSPTTLPFPSILSPSLPRGTRQYGRHVSPSLIWSATIAFKYGLKMISNMSLLSYQNLV